ncbi:MAG: ABC transporter ATP-binding protein [Burkholderiaceae bacterium]
MESPPVTLPTPPAKPPHGPGEAPVPVLAIRGLNKTFGARTLLSDLALTVDPGQKIALMGESGAGKSTLLNIIAGLEAADSGRIELLGRALADADPDANAVLRRRHVGFVFQAFHLIAYLPVWQNVALPLMLLGEAQPSARLAALEWLERVGVHARANALARDLSGGEQQRVAIARALIHRPALVLADEPTGNLDPGTAARVLEQLCRAADDSGAALLMVTHSERAAVAMDSVLMLADGRLAPTTPTPDLG